MIYSVQPLLHPTGQKHLAETAIWMPDDLMTALRRVFTFDIGGWAELEGDKIFHAMRRLHGQEQPLCNIRFYAEELGDKAKFIYALAPLNKAEGVIDFIQDQMSEHPKISTAVHVGMRKTLLEYSARNEDGIIGWFDLDTPSWIFADIVPMTKMQMLLHCTDLPVIDRWMEYSPCFGGTIDTAKAQMQHLADVWGRAVSATLNGDNVTATPRPPVGATLTI